MKKNKIKTVIVSLFALISLITAGCSIDKKESQTYTLEEAKSVVYEKIDEINTDSRVLNNKITTTELFLEDEYTFTDRSAFYVNDSGEMKKALLDLQSKNYSLIYKDNKVFEVDGSSKGMNAQTEKNMIAFLTEELFSDDYTKTAITLNTPEVKEGKDELVSAVEENDKFIFIFNTNGIKEAFENQDYDGDLDSMTETTLYIFNKNMEVERFERKLLHSDGKIFYSEESSVKDYKW